MHFNPTSRGYHSTPLMRAVQIFLLVLIIIGVALLCTQKLWVPKLVAYIMEGDAANPIVTPSPEVQETVFDGRNATFTLDGTPVTLVNGISEKTLVTGSASKMVTRYFGNEAVGDLTGDGQPDVAFLISEETGGSGLFYYVVVAVQKGEGYQTTNAFLIGDRIAPQSTHIPENSLELQVNYAERRPGEPMSTPPSSGATLLLKVTPEGILEGLMK